MSAEAPRLSPGYRLVVRDTVGSTSDVARELAQAGAADGTVVWARRQTAGRGRLGRPFASPPGNLYASFVLRPRVAPAAAAELSFVAALAVAEAAAAVLPAAVAVTLKWPNDVLVAGAKLAGILLEASTTPDGTLDFLVLGIGINVTSHPTDVLPVTTDLAAAGARVAVPALLEGLAERLLAWRERWRADGFAPVRAAWLARAHGLGQPIEVRLGNTLISGSFADLDEDGAIIVASAAGARQRVTAGDVALVAPAPQA
jgi:BirA family biotin operon repressor/biotin-[acetyl-CoA-carboxylase] ligase